MSNPFRAWLLEQPRAVNMRTLAEDIGVDASYVSDLMDEKSVVMPSLVVAFAIEKRTKGKVTARQLHDFAMQNRARQDEAA
jgi:DNA-binding transcriptional regulator YdaS (Cro superfamily)